MEILGLISGITLPWALGIVWLRAGPRVSPEGGLSWLLGYGYVLGALATTFLMRGLDLLGVPMNLGTIGIPMTALIALGVWIHRDRPWIKAGNGQLHEQEPSEVPWQRWVFRFILLILILRFLGLALEVIWRPLYPWDAWAQWATKARVWYELGRMEPFVTPGFWLSSGSARTFTDSAPSYPATVPLLQVWMSFCLGRWDDALMNLPWLQFAMALGFAFYGQARISGGSPLFSIVFTYFLLSMPFLNTHVALAGYADLPMAAIYGMAAMAFFQWTRNSKSQDDPRQGWVAWILILACGLIKKPGLVWSFTFLPALWVMLRPKSGLAGTTVLGGLAVIALAIFGKSGFVFLNYSVRGEAGVPWEGLIRNLLILDNWHLLAYLVAGIVLLSWRSLFAKELRAMTVLYFCALASLAIAFCFSNAREWVKDYTTVNRAILHTIPLTLFYAMILFRERFYPAPLRDSHRLSDSTGSK